MIAHRSALLIPLFILWSPAALGQPTTPDQPSVAAVSGPSIPELKARLAETEANSTLDEGIKASVVELYQRALDALAAADMEQKRAGELQDVLNRGPSELERLRAELAAASAPAAAEPQSNQANVSMAELEQRLLQARGELAAARRAAADIDLAIKEQSTRPAAARQELTAAQSMLANIEREKAQLRVADEIQVVFEARAAALDARQRRRNAEISRLQSELLSHDVRTSLLALERDKAEIAVKTAEQTVAALERRLNAQRRSEAAAAQATAEEVKAEAEAKHPLLGEAAAVNAELAREQQRVAAEVTRKSSERARVAELANQVENEAQSTTKRVELAGMSDILGRYLRDQRNRLFSKRTFERDSLLRQSRISSISLRQLEIAEQFRELEHPDQAAFAAFLQSSAAAPAGADRDTLLKELEQLLVARRAALEALSSAYSSELRSLAELELEQQRLAEASAAFARFLDERLLWVPSARPVDYETIASLPAAFRWLFSPASWLETAKTLVDLARRNAWIAITIAVAALVILVTGSRLLRYVDRIGTKIGRVATDRFSFTLEAVAITVLAAAALPLLLGAIGWRLRETAVAGEFARAIGAGVVDASLLLAAGTALYTLCRPLGVAASHFNWDNGSLSLIRRHLLWWLSITTPALFLIAALDWQSDPSLNDSLGRIAFVIQAGALSVLSFFLLHPTKGLPSRYVRENADGWVSRLRPIWFPVAVLFPVGLLVAATTGFTYTAVSLENRLIVTIAVVFGGLFVHSLLLRWLHVTRRRLERANARERRAAAASRRAETPAATEAGVAVAIEADEPDIAALNEQTLHLLKVLLGAALLVGIYFVWADVLPALTVLSDIELWRYSGQINGEGATIPVSLQSILVVVFIGILVTVAAKNLPAALEIAVLQRLPLDPGLRYAIKTVSQYAIVAVGFTVILSDLGVGWSNIQWLVAALSVGLGFGLQEIVANFVSGLIILFERPVRIGDAVTVGDTTGTVTKVRIRATTLLDWDNREIIVPNKTFITERLVNWTLSDAITRVIIPIGIGYDSDVDRARQVILDAVKDNDLVIDSPPMRLLFRGLGDSALNFELYVYVRALSDRLVVADQLLQAVHFALRENGIEIPFRQQDIHFKDIEKLEAALAGRPSVRGTGVQSDHAPDSGMTPTPHPATPMVGPRRVRDK